MRIAKLKATICNLKSKIVLMPLVYQQDINDTTKLGIWHIAEPEDFFLKAVPLQKEITHPHKRLQHLAGRYLLQELFPNFPVELIKIADTKKPFLADEAYHFSISHCGDYAAVMVSKTQRVGVDIEKINEKIDRIFPKFLSPEECSLLPRGSINKTATLLWSVKESIFKWYGAGQVDFKEHIQVRSVNGENEGIVQVDFLKQDVIHFDVHFLFFNGNFLSWVFTGIPK
jgi:phosphopantetheinyl transferase